LKVKETRWCKRHRALGRWYDYLQGGFRSLGIPVIFDEKLEQVRAKNSIVLRTPETNRTAHPIDIVYEDFTQRIYYDMTDFTTQCYGVVMKEPGAIYFKISMLPEYREKYPRMRPMGQIIAEPKYSGYLKRLEKEKRARAYDCDIIGIFATTNYDLRVKAVEIINSQDWKSLAWVWNTFLKRPKAPSALVKAQLGIKEHLELQSRAKLCLALPGIGNWTFRHVEVMGMGNCLVSLKPEILLPGNPENCWVQISSDFSDFVEIVDYYLKHEDERECIARNGAIYYDNYLSPPAQAKYMLGVISEMRK